MKDGAAFQNFFGVGLAGGIGTLVRYYANMYLGAWATGSVNALGCLGIGYIWVLGEKGLLTPAASLFLATGLLGGLTTFSTFALELHRFAKSGAWGALGCYGLAHLLLGAGLVSLGGILANWVTRN